MAGPSHTPGNRKAEEKPGNEAGRQDTGSNQTGRPMGKSDARHATGINSADDNPIDPESPELPPA